MPYSTGERNHPIYIALLVIGLLVLFPFLLLTLYNHPQADDYGFAVRDMTYGYWEAQATYYMNWTGRYFSTNTAFRINPLISGPLELQDSLTVYRFYSFTLILLLASSVWLLLFTLFRRYIVLKSVSALSALLFCLYLLQMPSVSEGVFWMPGYLTYQLPNCMLLLLLASLIGFFRNDNRARKTAFIGLAAMLCIAVVGSNEMSIVLAFTTILFILCHNWHDNRNRPYILFLFAVCAIACLVAVLAPGNYARMEDHPNAKKPVWAIIYAAFLTGLSFYRWLAPVLLATILYVFYWGLPLTDKLKSSRIFQVKPFHALFYYLTTLFLMQFAFTWAVGERPTPRVENVIYFFFVFGWFYNVQVALTRYGHLLQAERKLSPVFPFAVFILFLLQVFSMDSNIMNAYIDLASGKAPVYDKALQQRYVYLRDSGCDSCVVAPLPAIPQTLYFKDILEGPENSGFWVNADFADYWNKAAIYLSAPNPEIKDNVTTLRETGKELLAE